MSLIYLNDPFRNAGRDMNENDRRVKKTKALLKQSLAELLCEKDIKNITIKELTDRVSISRNAFYTHYVDIYDLYDQMEQELFSDINALLTGSPLDEYEAMLSTLLDYIQEHASIMRAFLCTEENYKFRIKLSSYFEQKFIEITLFEMNTSDCKDDWKYLINYHSYGTISAITMWIEDNFIYPKEKLLKMIMDIDEKSDCLYEE